MKFEDICFLEKFNNFDDLDDTQNYNKYYEISDDVKLKSRLVLSCKI